MGHILSTSNQMCSVWLIPHLTVGVEQELVGRKGNLGKTSNSVEVYFLPFQFLFNPYRKGDKDDNGWKSDKDVKG